MIAITNISDSFIITFDIMTVLMLVMMLFVLLVVASMRETARIKTFFYSTCSTFSPFYRLFKFMLMVISRLLMIHSAATMEPSTFFFCLVVFWIMSWIVGNILGPVIKFLIKIFLKIAYYTSVPCFVMVFGVDKVFLLLLSFWFTRLVVKFIIYFLSTVFHVVVVVIFRSMVSWIQKTINQEQITTKIVSNVFSLLIGLVGLWESLEDSSLSRLIVVLVAVVMVQVWLSLLAYLLGETFCSFSSHKKSSRGLIVGHLRTDHDGSDDDDDIIKVHDNQLTVFTTECSLQADYQLQDMLDDVAIRIVRYSYTPVYTFSRKCHGYYNISTFIATHVHITTIASKYKYCSKTPL